MKYVFVQVKDNKFIVLDSAETFHAKDAYHAGSTLEIWTEDQLKELDVYKVEQNEVPIGKRVNSVSYKFDGDKVVEVLELVDFRMMVAPPPPNSLIKSQNNKGDRDVYKEQIDEQSLIMRTSFMTKGMWPVYEAKRKEAEAYLHDRKPDLKEYPFLKASVETRTDGDNAYDIASRWLVLSRQCNELMASIEVKRLKAKAQIDATNSTDEMEKIVHDFNVQ